MRLVADLGKEQKVAGERLKEIEELTRDRDIAKQKVREAELELQQVKDSLKHSQEAWNETRERLTEQDIKLVFSWIFWMSQNNTFYYQINFIIKHIVKFLFDLRTVQLYPELAIYQ